LTHCGRSEKNTMRCSKVSRTLREASYPPVQYIPLNDVDTALLDGVLAREIVGAAELRSPG
jgi:hypothetical protein